MVREAPGSLADPAIQRCPYAFYRAAHATAPVLRDPTTGLWLVIGYEALKEAASRWHIFSSEIDMRRDISTASTAESDALLAREGWIAPDVLSQVDPPKHTRYRRLVERIFTGPVVRRMRSDLDAHVRELIESFADRGRADFLREFAMPLPVHVIVEQLGLPREASDSVARWTDSIIATLDVMITAERRLECTRDIVAFQKYFVAQRAAKRARPADDILSALEAVRHDDGVPLSEEEFIAICAQLMVAGNETTRNHLVQGMHLLASHPGLQTELRAQPARVSDFVMETLRLESPVQGLFRVCRADTVLAGVPIPKGAQVVLMYGAANRDPAAFVEPDALRLDRANAAQHLAFGYGVHACIGRVLATAELEIAFRRLLERLDDIRLAADAPAPTVKPHFSLRALDSLQIEFTPRPQAL